MCENLARLGADVKLLSCVGDDVFGSYIRSWGGGGVDIRYLHEAKGAHSSIYLSILDADGDMLVGMSDMRIVQQDLPADYLPSQKQLIQGAKVVTCDPCMGKRRCCSCWTCASRRRSCASTRSPARMRASSRRSSAGSTRPSPTAWSWRSWPGWRSVPTPICSARAKWSLSKGLKRLFVSLGAEGCFYMDDTGAVLRRKLRPAKMVNASGAGDSFAAAMLYATLQGYDAEKTLDYGMAAGIAAVTHERTINPNMSVPLLESILQTYRL